MSRTFGVLNAVIAALLHKIGLLISGGVACAFQCCQCRVELDAAEAAVIRVSNDALKAGSWALWQFAECRSVEVASVGGKTCALTLRPTG